MGLLDEAIRDHLELKRRSGADPGEIAHAERAALAPVFRDEPRAEDDGSPPAAVAEQVPAGVGEGPGDPEGPLGDETVEIDMQAVLAADGGTVPAQLDGAAAPAADDAFTWDDAVALEHDADAAGPPEQIPGQERMSLE